MAKVLPRQIDPMRLCDMGAKLEGEIPLQAMKRIAELVAEKNGTAAISFVFGKERQGFRSICGKIVAHLVLTCQRCLQPMPYDLELKVALSPVYNEGQAANLPKDFDMLLVGEEPMLLVDIIEDELLLNLPIIAKHKDGECPVKLPDLLN